jgi:hypothetical protein
MSIQSYKSFNENKGSVSIENYISREKTTNHHMKCIMN